MTVEGSCHMVGNKMTVSCLPVSPSAILFCILLVLGLLGQLNTTVAKPSSVISSYAHKSDLAPSETSSSGSPPAPAMSLYTDHDYPCDTSVSCA